MAVNCRTLIERAAARGLPVLVVQTVRDVEYQRYLVSMGYAARTATVPTFHAKGVGLAFDICKNVKGHEYDDPGFFTAMGRLGKEMGFTWGGDWRSFPDRPHFQWDGGGKYTSSMVRAGRYPPPMPRFEEEDARGRGELLYAEIPDSAHPGEFHLPRSFRQEDRCLY